MHICPHSVYVSLNLAGIILLYPVQCDGIRRDPDMAATAERKKVSSSGQAVMDEEPQLTGVTTAGIWLLGKTLPFRVTSPVTRYYIQTRKGLVSFNLVADLFRSNQRGIP